MAFSAEEVRVLRRALAEALHPSRAAATVAPRPAEYVQDYLRLAAAVDDAADEAGRLRAFQLDELSRYRRALPGSVAGYLERLTAALAAGYRPTADDLAALRRLRALPSGTPEHRRRTALLRRCETLAENDVRLRLEAHMTAPRRLLALPGARLAAEPDPAEKKPAPKAPSPQPPAPGQDPARKRPPTPAEIWPPGRRPAPGRKGGKEEGDGGEHGVHEAAGAVRTA